MTLHGKLAVVALCVVGHTAVAENLDVTVEPSAADRVYDGHGALSAGASSRLLLDYPEPQRSTILDYLFKPGYGASLHHLKVEIGGDTWSTDGSEPSHLHTRDSKPDFDSGWEWWLLEEAKKRNPEIVTYGLSWGVPGWVGDGHFLTKDNIYNYTLPWLRGARDRHGVDIDYLGVWNERQISADYVKDLRQALNQEGFQKVKLVVSDNAPGPRTKDIEEAMLQDEALNASVDVIGLHYPRGRPDPLATQLHKTLWASESLTTSADWAGTSLWARTLNQNFVRANMTAAISWSLIWSVYPSLICTDHGLMDAWEPWSGYYRVAQQIWATAHTTMFTKPGWKYTPVGKGSGLFAGGAGSYLTMVSPGEPRHFTMVVEFMAEGGSDDTVLLNLALPSDIEFWHAWVTNRSVSMLALPEMKPWAGKLTLEVKRWHMYTLTTVDVDARKIGGGNDIRDGLWESPITAALPLPHREDFMKGRIGAPGRFFNDQEGTFQMVELDDGQRHRVLRQMSLDEPVRWGPVKMDPATIIGAFYQNYRTQVTARAVEDASTAALQAAGGDVYVGLCGRLGQPYLGKQFGFSSQAAVCLKVYHNHQTWALEYAGIRRSRRSKQVLAASLHSRWAFTV
eukprot:TRINITY_DN18221_c0_g1_i3.p1 TRINITY_DN18221_c0_g1~~TRINITY_DN18221_c0_g1_i3.p1  ORF type:complete len:638 (-),score=79.47 TRINITY_DN18221_c0_g1_i3:71-1939(-)